jgi:hypothetical protein
MSQYLQRLNILSVEEVGVDNIVLPQYQQIVEVVEVVDNDGNPWEPVPGPDPWDELVWVNKSSTTGSTVLGSVLTGTPGTTTGGKPPVVVVSQWQRSATTSGFTGFSDWVELGDTPVTYTTTIDDNGMYVRLATKATDDDGVVYYGSGNSVGPMAPAAITVSQATKISNGSYVNPPEVFGFEDLTVVPAVFAGGFGTLSALYRLQKQQAGTAEGSWTNVTNWESVPPTEPVNGSTPGSKYRAQSKVTDSASQSKTSNSPTPTVGLVSTIGTVSITPANTTTEAAGNTTFTVSWDGDVVSPMIVWEIRSGPGQIISPNNMSVEVEVQATGQPGATIQVQVYVSDPSSSDSPQSTIASLLITE